VRKEKEGMKKQVREKRARARENERASERERERELLWLLRVYLGWADEIGHMGQILE